MSVGEGRENVPWLCRMPFLSVINRICVAAAGVSILALLIYNSYATCARYLFDAPPPGSMEISTFMLPVIVFLGLAHNLEVDKHIGVDVFVCRLSERKQAVLSLFSTILIGIIAAVLIWKGIALCMDKYGEVSDSELALPLLPFYVFVPFGALLLFLESIRKLCLYAYRFRNAMRRKAAGAARAADVAG